MQDSQTDLIDIDREFAAAVLSGLAGERKRISSAWLYDTTGSALYEDITHLPEYYVARTETGILERHAGAIAAQLPARATVIEYGAGAAIKTRLLLDAMDTPAVYAPIDISADFLKEAAETLAGDYPGIEVRPVVGHFLEEIDLGDIAKRPDRVGFFPGSTVGNLSDAEILRFLGLARGQLGAAGRLVIGIDRAKAPDILIPAYDDAEGVTARFNLNLLARINRELGADFDLDAFHHEARWNAALSRVEMHLVSDAEQTARLLGRQVRFRPGETIHTEISRKFRPGEFEGLAAEGGWRIADRWSDERDYFSVLLLAPAAG